MNQLCYKGVIFFIHRVQFLTFMLNLAPLALKGLLDVTSQRKGSFYDSGRGN